MKKSILFLITSCIFLGVSGQESEQKEENYSGDLIYILPDSQLDDEVKQVKLLLQLDKLAFENVSKIIVEQNGLDEPGDVIGKSYHFNFEDMVIGWDKSLRKRFKDQNEIVLLQMVRELEMNDKVKLYHEKFQVEIDLGFIQLGNTTQVVNVKLEYKDQIISNSLVLIEQVKFRQ